MPSSSDEKREIGHYYPVSRFSVWAIRLNSITTPEDIKELFDHSKAELIFFRSGFLKFKAQNLNGDWYQTSWCLPGTEHWVFVYAEGRLQGSVGNCSDREFRSNYAVPD